MRSDTPKFPCTKKNGVSNSYPSELESKPEKTNGTDSGQRERNRERRLFLNPVTGR